MKRLLNSWATLLLAAGGVCAQQRRDSALRRFAAGMLMVGFNGASLGNGWNSSTIVISR